MVAQQISWSLFFYTDCAKSFLLRNNEDSLSNIMSSESTLDTYLKSYSEKTVGNNRKNFIRKTVIFVETSESKIKARNLCTTLEFHEQVWPSFPFGFYLNQIHILQRFYEWFLQI